MEFKFDEFGNVVDQEYEYGDNSILLQRAMLIIRSHNNDMFDVPEGGNPISLLETLSQKLAVEDYNEKLERIFNSDPIIKGQLKAVVVLNNGSLILGILPTVVGIEYGIDTHRFFNIPTNPSNINDRLSYVYHTPIYIPQYSNEFSEIVLPGCSFINQYFFNISTQDLNEDDFQYININLNCSLSLDILPYIIDQIKLRNFFIYEIIANDKDGSLYATKDGLIFTNRNSKLISFKIKYIPTNYTQIVNFTNTLSDNTITTPYLKVNPYTCTITGVNIIKNTLYYVLGSKFAIVDRHIR